MAISENLQKHFDEQPVNPALIVKLDAFGIDPMFREELQTYLSQFGWEVVEILEDPRVQKAIRDGDDSVTGRKHRREIVFQAANDNLWNMDIAA